MISCSLQFFFPRDANEDLESRSSNIKDILEESGNSSIFIVKFLFKSSKFILGSPFTVALRKKS